MINTWSKETFSIDAIRRAKRDSSGYRRTASTPPRLTAFKTSGGGAGLGQVEGKLRLLEAGVFEDVKVMILALQPVFIVIIGAIAYEDGQQKRAGR